MRVVRSGMGVLLSTPALRAGIYRWLVRVRRSSHQLVDELPRELVVLLVARVVLVRLKSIDKAVRHGGFDDEEEEKKEIHRGAVGEGDKEREGQKHETEKLKA